MKPERRAWLELQMQVTLVHYADTVPQMKDAVNDDRLSILCL